MKILVLNFNFRCDNFAERKIKIRKKPQVRSIIFLINKLIKIWHRLLWYLYRLSYVLYFNGLVRFLSRYLPTWHCFVTLVLRVRARFIFFSLTATFFPLFSLFRLLSSHFIAFLLCIQANEYNVILESTSQTWLDAR